MTSPKSRPSLAATLQAAAASYQEAHVIGHCTVCASPCCRLDKLVLELNWQQVRTLWKIEEARPAFDRRLAAEQGPEEIRAGNGLYYVHSKPCPAYDDAGHRCRVYGQPVKPAGCSDFPVYGEEESITADLRCEAVDLEALTAWVGKALPPGTRIVQYEDRDFPFLVSLEVSRPPANPKPGAGKGRRKPR